MPTPFASTDQQKLVRRDMAADLDFQTAIQTVLRHEGGFVNHPSDPGGATNYGVSIRWLRSAGDLDGDGLPDGDIDGDGDVDIRDIRLMTPEDARALYFMGWWQRYGYKGFGLPVSTKLFDTAVNMGHKQMTRLAQRAANIYGAGLTVDGQMGPRTRAAIKHIGWRQFLAGFRDQQWQFYRGLIENRPQFKAFEKGWRYRAYS